MTGYVVVCKECGREIARKGDGQDTYPGLCQDCARKIAEVVRDRTGALRCYERDDD